MRAANGCRYMASSKGAVLIKAHVGPNHRPRRWPRLLRPLCAVLVVALTALILLLHHRALLRSQQRHYSHHQHVTLAGSEEARRADTTQRTGATAVAAIAVLSHPARQRKRQFIGSDSGGSGDNSNVRDEPDEKEKEAATAPLKFPVWWHAPFLATSGYGTEAISYLVPLLQGRLIRPEDLWVTHMGDIVTDNAVDNMAPDVRLLLARQDYNSLRHGRLSNAAMARPAIAICHTMPDCWYTGNETYAVATDTILGCPCPVTNHPHRLAYRVGRTMFETSGLPPLLVEHCNAMDEVWVPTEFNRATFAAAGVAADKLRVVPQGINASLFDPELYDPVSIVSMGAALATGRRLPPRRSVGRSRSWGGGRDGISSSATTVFLSIFKWELRKGWDLLLRAFATAFNATDPVELHILTHAFGSRRADFAPQIRAWLRDNLALSEEAIDASLPRIYVHHHHVHEFMYPRIYKSASVVVLPTRGEGWGRPQMEAMAMGVPVITTNWSGPTAFMNEDVGYPLRVSGLTPVSNREAYVSHFFLGQQWAAPDVDHLKQLMRHVVAHPAEAEAKGRAARQHLVQNFTPERVARVVLAEIQRIQDKLAARQQQQRQQEQGTKATTQPSLQPDSGNDDDSSHSDGDSGDTRVGGGVNAIDANNADTSIDNDDSDGDGDSSPKSEHEWCLSYPELCRREKPRAMALIDPK